MKDQSSAQNVVGIFATRLAMFPLSIIVAVVVARVLGPHDRGIYAFLILLGNFLLPLLSFGFGTGISYFLSSGRFKVEDVAFSCLIVGFCQGLVCALLIFLLWNSAMLGRTASIIPSYLLLPILLLMPIQGIDLMVGRILYGTSSFSKINTISLVKSAITPLLMLGLVVLGGLRLSGAVLTIVLVNLVSSSYVTSVIWRIYSPAFRVNTPFLRSGFLYGLKAWGSDVALRLNLRVDQFICGLFVPAVDLGNYSVAISITESLWTMPDSVGPVMFNRVAALKDEKLRSLLTDRLHRIGCFLMTLIALVIGSSASWLIPLMYGRDFSTSILLIQLLLPGTVAIVSPKILTKYFSGAGLPGKSSLVAILGAAVGMSLYLVLIPLHGVVGAAIASTLGYTATAGAAVVLYKRQLSPTKTALFEIRADDFRWLGSQVKRILPRSLRRGISK